LGGSSPGDGALRSTKAADDPEAFVIYNNPITSTDGLTVRFDFYSNGSSEQYNAQDPSISPQPGDDLGFFLIDGTASPERTGGYGGSGAYAPRTGIPGMEGGDLGLELDEFGNFSTSTEGRSGQEPARIPGSSIGFFRPDSVIAPATRSGISNTARSSEATFDRLATNNNGSPTNKDGTPTNSTVTTSIAPNADLATTKTGSTSATPGSSVSYTIATANLGPSPAEAVTITDSIVPGLTGVTASNGGVYEPATGIVPEGPVAIAKAQTLTRTIGLTVPPTLTSIRNTARSTSIAPDSTPANNNGTNPNATVTTSIDAVADIVTQGPNAAENVVITDSIIPGLTGVRASNNATYEPVTGVVTFPTIPSLTSGSNTNRQVKLVVPATGTISHTSGSRSTTFDLEPSNNNGSQPRATVTTAISAQSTPNLLPISQQQQRCASTQQRCQNQQARRQRLRQHSSYRNNGSKALPF
jgi:uncharacterized repeat protein (TIGR01451 family)